MLESQLEITFGTAAIPGERMFGCHPWWESRERARAARCPECGRPTNTYHRKISSSMGWKLVRLHRLGLARPGGFFHVSEFDVLGGRGESGTLSLWGLVEERANEDLKKKTSGFWRLTPFGEAFVRLEKQVPKYAIVRYRSELVGFAGVAVGLREVLGKGGGFDYRELLQAPLPGLLP
jgi:hypothetical protein